MESPEPVPSPSLSSLPARLPLGVGSSYRLLAISKISTPSVCPAVPEIDDTGDGAAGQGALRRRASEGQS